MIQGHSLNPHPKAFFIADAAVGEDLTTNYALSGYQGTLLTQFCKGANLHIGDFYRTALIKEEYAVKPQGEKFDDYYKGNSKLIEKYKNILIQEINDLRPNLLIPLGELSFHFLTSHHGIRKFRGSVLAPNGDFNFGIPNIKVMPILGPYPYLYADYKQHFINRVDFAKIPQYLNDRPIPDDFFKIWVARSSSAFRAFLERSFNIDSILVFDIETFFGIPTCISFCFDSFESVCVPLLDPSIDFDNRVLMIDLVAKVLKSPIKKVNQNIKYDWKILERFGFEVNNVIGDTMLAASTLYCEFPKNLGFLTSIYTDLPYFKDEGKKAHDVDPSKRKKDTYYLYNAKDSLATHQVYIKQQKEVDELGTRWVYDKLIQLMPIYKRMENRGLRVDTLQREILLAKYYNLYEIECAKLSEFLGKQYVNPLSSKLMQKVVYEELGYAPVRGVKRNKSGSVSADEDSLALLRIFGEAKRAPSTGPLILDTIIACRKFHKVIEILELPLWPDGRFRCEFNLAGTETGRTSAGSTTDRLLMLDNGKINEIELGHSLQTIGKHGFSVDGETYGKDIRSMFVPSRGYRFVEIDLSGAEARVDAVLAGTTDLGYFEDPGIHRLTGSWCFKCTPSEIKKGVLVPFGSVNVDRYHVAKQVRHASERNIQAPGLVTKLLWGLTVRQGEELLKQVHTNEPNIKQVFHKQVEIKVKTEHCLKAPNGRRRDFFDRIDNSVINEAISTLPQAIVSDQTKFHGILATALECEWAEFLAEMHDGVLAEVPIGREEEFIEKYQKNISEPIDFNTCSLSRDFQLTIPSEAAIGETWDDMQEVD